MSFRRQQSSKYVSSPEKDPLRITISEFKFKPTLKTQPIPKVKPNPEMESNILTQLIPRRGLSFRSDREKRVERLSGHQRVLLTEQPLQSSPSFKKQQERAHSSKKIFLPADKLLLEMMKSNIEYGLNHSQSERKMTSRYDIESRRYKIQTANRVKGNSPMELLTRKLEWKGKEVKRIEHYTVDSKNFRINPAKETHKKCTNGLEDMLLSDLKGWEPEQSNQFWLG